MKILLTVLFFITAPIASGNMTGLQIMTRVDQNNKQLATMSSEVQMTILRGKDTRKRSFYHLKKYKNNVTKSLLKFYLPADSQGNRASDSLQR